MEFSGRSAIVTGSAVGVGRATALKLARRGVNVAVNYSRSEQEAKETAAEVERLGAKALLVRADVSQDQEVRAMVAAASRRSYSRTQPASSRNCATRWLNTSARSK